MGSTSEEANEFIRKDLRHAAYGQSTNLAFNEKIKKLISNGKDICHLAFGESPFPVPECLTEALKDYAHCHEYLSTIGLSELRQEISKLHHKIDGLDLDPEKIIIGPGSKEIVYLIMTTFSGDILLPSPAWVTYGPQIKLANKNALIIPSKESSEWKISPEILEKSLQGCSLDTSRLLILNSPGNPSGLCYTEEELRNLSDFCRRNNIIVLSDEIYANLTFSRNHVSIAKYYPDGTILTSGFSKWASCGGWRVGYAHFPSRMQSFFNVVRNAGSHTYSCAPTPMQYAIAKALRNNSQELAYYAEICSRVLNIVGKYCYRELISVGVTGHRSQAGYYFIPNFEVIREGLKKRGILTGPQMTSAMLEEANVALMSLCDFLRPESELTVRLCFVFFDGQSILEGLVKSPTLLNDEKALENFVLGDHCKNLTNGIQRLKIWVQKHK